MELKQIPPEELEQIARKKIASAAFHMVYAERKRQIDTGRTPERDQLYHMGELGRAAASYAAPKGFRRVGSDNVTPLIWPWGPGTFKSEPQTVDGRLVELAKAGALILAEMERILAKDAAG